MTEDEPIYRPQQARSRQTMNRMLDAAEELLETRSWQELTVQEVVGAAGTSVGAFYGRFKDKEGLLHALDERYFEYFIELIETTVAGSDWDGLSLGETIGIIAQLTVTLHSRRQGMMRALILQARLVNDPRFRMREARLRTYTPRLLALVLAHRQAIIHPDPEAAVRFGFLQMFYSAREMLIWPHLTATMPYQGEALAQALAHAFLSYLRSTPEER